VPIGGPLCGADRREDIHRFGQLQEDWLRTPLQLPHGLPGSDTLNRVFRLLDPKAFGECFLAWVRHVRKQVPGDIVALDGKTLRASMAEGRPPLVTLRISNLKLFTVPELTPCAWGHK